MQWNHIEVYFDTQSLPLRLHDARAVIALEFEKGSKRVRNDRRFVTLTYLDQDLEHMCPVTWLLIHALRNDMITGSPTSLHELLDLTAQAPEHRVQWKHPSYPVFAALNPANQRLDFPRSASTTQLDGTIKEMAIVANVVGRIHSHALRSGAARDIAHLPKSANAEGVTTDEVRQSLGHATGSRAVTENYIGGVTRDFYSARAAASVTAPQKKYVRNVKFGDQSGQSLFTTMKMPIQLSEIKGKLASDDDIDETTIAALDPNTRRKLHRQIRADRRETFTRTQPIEVHVQEDMQKYESILPDPPRRSATRDRPVDTLPVSCRNTDNTELDNIDPELLDSAEELQSIECSTSDLAKLTGSIFIYPPPEHCTTGLE